MTTHKSEGPAVTGPNANQRTVIQDSSYRAKRLQTITAQFALAGTAVNELSDGSYQVTRGCISRHGPDLDSLVAFARQMEMS
jgi:hypothetical protein